MSFPNSVIPNLINLTDQFYASLFYQHESNVIYPLKTIKCNISGLYDEIKSAFNSNRKGEFCITLEIKSKKDEKPELLSASKFYEKRAKLSHLRCTMVIIVDSSDECKDNAIYISFKLIFS